MINVGSKLTGPRPSLQKTCIERTGLIASRPVTRASVDTLLHRINELEQRLAAEGVSVSPSTKLSTKEDDGGKSIAAASPPCPTAQRALKPGAVSANFRTGRAPDRYFGITTNYHILSDWYHSEDRSSHGTPSAANQKVHDFLSTFDAATLAYLLSSFWEHYNQVLPVVYRQAFETDVEVGGESYYSGFLHLCMLAIGWRYAHESVNRDPRLTSEGLESVFHREAKGLVDQELKVPGGIPSVQALLLLGDLECGLGKYNTGWLYAGMATRLCFDLGLNREYTAQDSAPIDKQVRETAMWACLTLDR